MAHRQELRRSRNTAVDYKSLRRFSGFSVLPTSSLADVSDSDVLHIGVGRIVRARCLISFFIALLCMHACNVFTVVSAEELLASQEQANAEQSKSLLPDETNTDGDFQPLFDGKTFKGWNGDENVFRIEDGAIVGGQLKERIPHNFFLSTDADYEDFELRLEFRLIGEDTNAGIQIRSERIPEHHEMIGYQADLGQNYWGCLYDESRRNRVLASPKAEELAAVLKKDDWNSYRILCKGRQIQLWINDLQTVDFTEQDLAIVQKGKIAVQIHGGPAGEAWYRNIRIRKL
ncbi:MAG: DUF1080 domain-containing protein [Planctomyces sp.]|nr:DUF1080 domain-containing protein [Planctomyces sp.]